MATDIREAVLGLEDIGVYEVLLPFLLVFVISFIALEKIRLIRDHRINSVLSVLLAFYFIRNQVLVGILIDFLPNLTMFLLVLFGFVLLMGIFAGEEATHPWLYFIAVIVSIIAILRLYAGANLATGGAWDWLRDNITEENIGWLIFIGIIAIVVSFFTWGRKDKGKKVAEAVGKALYNNH